MGELRQQVFMRGLDQGSWPGDASRASIASAIRAAHVTAVSKEEGQVRRSCLSW